MKLASLKGHPEIFHTLQGEGKSIGMPCVFVRLSLCNLHCIWCDTDYTWNWKGTKFAHVRDSDPSYEKYDMDQMITVWSPEKIAVEILAYDCPNLVITGGEPLMQENELIRLLTILRQRIKRLHVEIETNGTLIPGKILSGLLDQFNVSPKLENSANKKALRDKPDVMKFFAGDPRSTFKFVIDQPADLEEVMSLIRKYDLPRKRVYLMPQGIKKQELRHKRIWLADICKQENLNFTDRMHIHLFGNKRGV